LFDVRRPLPAGGAQECHSSRYRRYHIAPRLATRGLYCPRLETGLKRADLDRLARHYSLDPGASAALLDLADARPSRTESLTFLARCFRYAGVLSLGASVVFFVAANWSRIAVFGRFALLEVLLAIFVAIALYKPPPRFFGRAATLLAFTTTGALLALFGQTYQTGADVYELFLTWALLGLPFAVAAQWSVATAAWLLVLDLALALFCGWNPRGGIFWSVFGDGPYSATYALMFAALLNLAGWLAFERLQWRVVPDWVRKLILFGAIVFITWLGFAGVISEREWQESSGAWRTPHEDWLAIGAWLLATAAIAFVCLRQRRDIYPLALAMASFVGVGLGWITRWMSSNDEAVFFTMALWLIATSTLGSRLLLRLARAWREPAP
jgi:uncharacterized membrane protein